MTQIEPDGVVAGHSLKGTRIKPQLTCRLVETAIFQAVRTDGASRVQIAPTVRAEGQAGFERDNAVGLPAAEKSPRNASEISQKRQVVHKVQGRGMSNIECQPSVVGASVLDIRLYAGPRITVGASVIAQRLSISVVGPKSQPVAVTLLRNSLQGMVVAALVAVQVANRAKRQHSAAFGLTDIGLVGAPAVDVSVGRWRRIVVTRYRRIQMLRHASYVADCQKRIEG